MDFDLYSEQAHLQYALAAGRYAASAAHHAQHALGAGNPLRLALAAGAVVLSDTVRLMALAIMGEKRAAMKLLLEADRLALVGRGQDDA